MADRTLYNFIRGSTKDKLLKMSLTYCKHGHTMLSHPKCFIEEEQENIGFLDIETTALDANFGHMVTWCILGSATGKIVGDGIKRDEIFSGDSDMRITESLVAEMQKYSRLVTWYGARFDIPFIRTRALFWNIDFPKYKQLVHTDAYDIAKRKLKLHSNRLESVCEFLKIPAKGHRLTPSLLRDSRIGKEYALKDIMEHNKEDVISLRDVWGRLNEFTHLNKTSI